jgi:hypothetical protein
MKYYLVMIQNGNTQAIYEKASYDEALSAFHSELAYRAESRKSTMCMIIDGDGNVYKREMWPMNEGGES